MILKRIDRDPNSIFLAGATFAENFNYDPEFLLSFMPVFLVTTVGLLIENLPILIILRSLRNESNIPLPMIRV